MADAITYKTLFSNSWQNVKDLVDNTSNVVDPTTTSAEYRKWVYSREPDVNSSDFAGFPYIVVNSSVVNPDAVQTVDGSKSWVNFDCEIEVVSSDRAWNNNDGKGQIHNDAISDDLMEVFNSTTHRNTLRTNGLKFSRPVATGVVVESFKDTLIYRRSFMLSFKTYMAVRS